MKPNRTIWFLIFSACLILSLACGGGGAGGAGGAPGGGSQAGGAQAGGSQAGGTGVEVDGVQTGGGAGGVQIGGGSGGAQTGGGVGGVQVGGADGEQAGGNNVAGIAGAVGGNQAGGIAIGGETGLNVSIDGEASDMVQSIVSEATGGVSGATDSDAAQIIEQYARDVLGIGVTVLAAGSQDVETSGSTQSDVSATADVSGVVYAGTFSGGVASVTLGSGDVSGDVEADIQSASLGSFSLTQSGTVSDENSALNLIKSTYPGIANLPYTAQEVDVLVEGDENAQQAADQIQEQSYTFVAQTQENTVDVQNGQALITAVVVVVGVTSSQGQTIVYAVVGRGDLASSVQ